MENWPEGESAIEGFTDSGLENADGRPGKIVSVSGGLDLVTWGKSLFLLSG